MRHRKLAINGTLLAAVVAMATLGYVAVAGTGSTAPTTARTATVAQGDITALVSAGGNATSAMYLGVNFTDCTGPLTAISVKPGQVVSAGQPLATVDPTKAHTALTNAEAQLTAVQPADYTGGAAVGDSVLASTGSTGTLAVTPAGYTPMPSPGAPTDGQLASDETALIAAQNTYKAEQSPNSTVNQAVTTAQKAVTADAGAVNAAQLTLSNTRSANPVVPATVAAAQDGLAQDQHQLVTDEATLNSADWLLTATLSFDQQSITYWQAEVTYDRGQSPAPTAPAPVPPSGQASSAPTGGKTATPAPMVTAPRAAGKTAAAAPTSAAPPGGSSSSASGKAAATPAGGSSSAADSGAVSTTRTGASSASGGSTTPSQTAMNSAEQAVTAAAQTLTDCTLTAPVSGTVITVNGVVGAPPSTSSASTSSSGSTGGGSSGGGSSASGGGSAASGGSTSTSAATSSGSGFVTIANLNQMQITGAFSETDVSNVQPGQQASVVFPALTDADDPAGLTATGTVTSVALSSVVTNSVVTYGVTVALTNPSPRIKLGQTGNITVTTASQTGVLTVPTNAISTLGGTKTVTVQNGSANQVTPVQVGIAGNGLTEITSGLAEGQKIVLPSATPSTSSSGGFPRTGGAAGGLGGGGARSGGGS